MMTGKIEERSARAKMEELWLIYNKDIQIRQEKMDSAVTLFRKTLDSIKARAENAVQNQVKMGKLKSQLRDVEDDLVKALAAKTRNEAKRMAVVDSISATKARIDEVKKIVQDQRTRKDEFATIIAQQCLVLSSRENKGDQQNEHKKEIQEAILWYNKVLGLKIEAGYGVKFIFTNINMKNPAEEYSFSVRLVNDAYTLLECNPQLNDTKELIHELNETNGLFKFVRIMRAKFQEAAVAGSQPEPTSLCQDSSTVSISAPAPSVATENISESPAEQRVLQYSTETDRLVAKLNRGRGKQVTQSPGSAIYPRRSPRFKVSP
ncbi:Chromosome segregation protein Spc25, C-terminal, partial [Dillenia turbinata]